MRKIIFFSVVVMAFSASSSYAESDCIINPELMNKGVWAEPVFPAATEVQGERQIASHVSDADAEQADAKLEKNPSQYLEVLKEIPTSEPTIHKAWVEQSVLSEF